MTIIQQYNNKKRKHDDDALNQHYSAESDDGEMFDDENFERVLYEEMIRANNQLISIGSKIKLVDNLYFAKNGTMLDEFIENMNQFMKQLESLRKKVTFRNINSDILMNVYQFLDTKTLMNYCALISKFWRESLIGLKVSPCHDNFWNSSLTNHVSELKWPSSNVKFESLSNCPSFNQLKILDLSGTSIDTKHVELLMKCHMPRLAELKMNEANINETNAIRLLSSNFMLSIKKLNLSSTACHFTNTFYKTVSESKNLQQITHLEIWNEWPQVGIRIDLLLKDKFKLEHLQLREYQSTYFTNLLTNGNYMNLTCLDISYCYIKNQEFANLLVSPNLPNLITLKANYLKYQCMSRERMDKTIAIFPANSQSSITELHFIDFRPEMFLSLFDHCPKLKKLKIAPNLYTTESTMATMMKSPTLTNLEILRIQEMVIEYIFINPIFSNLKELRFFECFFENVKVLSTCTNLVNLTTLDLGESYVDREELIEECSTILKTNPTFAKLKYIELPYFDDGI